MAVSWPTTLPDPILEGYGLSKGDGRLITKMEQGPRRIRKRFDNVPSEISLSFIMTAAEAGIFESFWDTTLDGGSLPFNIDIFEGGSLAAKDVQVISLGRLTPISNGLFRLTMRVETL